MFQRKKILLIVLIAVLLMLLAAAYYHVRFLYIANSVQKQVGGEQTVEVQNSNANDNIFSLDNNFQNCKAGEYDLNGMNYKILGEKEGLCEVQISVLDSKGWDPKVYSGKLMNCLMETNQPIEIAQIDLQKCSGDLADILKK